MESFSINEWCARHRICRANWYLLKARGETPETFKIGRLVRISAAADAAWVAAREAASRQECAA